MGGVWGQNGKNMCFFVVNQHFSPPKHTTSPKNDLYATGYI